MLGDHTTASGEVVHRPAQETCVCNDVAVVGEHPHSGGPEIVQVGQFNAGPALRDGTGRNHFDEADLGTPGGDVPGDMAGVGDRIGVRHHDCLLYTSDAADDLTRVDLGG